MKNRHFLICFVGGLALIQSGCRPGVIKVLKPLQKLFSGGTKVAPKVGKGASEAAKGTGQWGDDVARGVGQWGDDATRAATPAAGYADDVERQIASRIGFPGSAVPPVAREGSRASAFSLGRAIAKSKDVGRKLRKLLLKVDVGDLSDLYDAWQQIDALLESYDRQLEAPDITPGRRARLEAKAQTAATELDEIERRAAAYD